MVYPCVIIDLHATLACQDSKIYILEILLLEWLLAYYFVLSALPLTDGPSEVLWGGGVLLVKTYWVFIQNFGYEMKQHLVIQGAKLRTFLCLELALNSIFSM